MLSPANVNPRPLPLGRFRRLFLIHFGGSGTEAARTVSRRLRLGQVPIGGKDEALEGDYGFCAFGNFTVPSS
jgi:hypothetical protein